MPDTAVLSIPARQTFPTIRGHVSDEEGILDLTTADELSLIIDDSATGVYELPVTAIDPPESVMVNNQAVLMNWEASIGAGATDDVTPEFKGKLKIVWDASATPPAIQYCPQTGFIKIEVTVNVQEPS